MPISRFDREGIARLLDARSFERLQNKQRGGRSAQKGYRYETLFGAHRIARLLRKLVDYGEDALVEWQSEDFVDDFVVRRDSRTSFKGYQLKNSPDVAWAGEIEGDFHQQERLSRAEGYTDIRLRLVCSDRKTATTIAANVPDPIATYSRAMYFPWNPAILAVIRDNPWMAHDFGYLSRHVEPDVAEVSDVAQIIIGAWEILAPSAFVSHIMEKMRRTSPTVIRTLESDAAALARLDPAFVEILDRLPGFEYHIERGFLNWSAYGGSTSGTLSHDCFTDLFNGLQRHIVGLSPQSFDEIESLLL
jgi:hypothetical protein